MNHNPNFLAYDEKVGIGNFPLAKQGEKIRSKKYLDRLVSLSLEYLEEQGVKQQESKEEILGNVEVQECNKVNLGQHIPGLLVHLSQNVYIQESKYRYTLEQPIRLQQTKLWLTNQDVIHNTTLYQFLSIYNDILWELVDKSHHYTSPKISTPSHLEQYHLDHS